MHQIMRDILRGALMESLLRNVHAVSVALGRVSAAFGNEIARFKHSTLEIVKKITRKKVKKRTDVWRASASRT